MMRSIRSLAAALALAALCASAVDMTLLTAGRAGPHSSLLPTSINSFFATDTDSAILTPTGLPSLGGQFSIAYGTNSAGQIVGESSSGTADGRAVIWEGDQVISLGVLAGEYSRAEAINDAGQVAGASTTGAGQNRFSPGVHATLWDGDDIVDLGTLGGDASWAFDIDNQGRIVGVSTTEPTQTLVTLAGPRGFVWERGTMTPLGTLGGDYSRAEAINEAGQFVGLSLTASDEGHAVLWDGDQIIDLGTLGGAFSWANDINAHGQIVGAAETSTGEVHAFLWDKGVMTDLGTLGGANTWAYAINDEGLIVGESSPGTTEGRAVLWRAETVVELGVLQGGSSSSAWGINASSQIVGGSDTESSQYLAVVWSGVLSPAAMPTPTQAAPETNWDGSWMGEAVGVGSVDFTVRNDAIVSVDISYRCANGTSNGRIGDTLGQYVLDTPQPIVNGTAELSLDADAIVMTAEFTSRSTANGSIILSGTICDGVTVKSRWFAEKQ